MLRPANSILGSSRAQRRHNLRQERVRALGGVARGANAIFSDLWGTTFDLLVLCGLPLVYLAGAYLLLDLPGRWMMGREAPSLWGWLELLGAAAISLLGLVRTLQDAEPVAPVRPGFARLMLALGWVLAILLTTADLVR